MNEIAGNICIKNVSLLADRGKLLEWARVKLHESGYIYSKGKSRSKKLNPEMLKEDKPKLERINQQEGQYRVESLQDQVKDINKHITVKEKRIEYAQSTKNFKLCDQLCEEVTKLKSKRCELESALRILLHKGKRSWHYYGRKKSGQAHKMVNLDSESEEEQVIPQREKCGDKENKDTSRETKYVEVPSSEDENEAGTNPKPFL